MLFIHELSGLHSALGQLRTNRQLAFDSATDMSDDENGPVTFTLGTQPLGCENIMQSTSCDGSQSRPKCGIG